MCFACYVSSHGFAKGTITKAEQDAISKTQKEAGKKGKGRGKGRKKGKGKKNVQDERDADAEAEESAIADAAAAPNKGKGKGKAQPKGRAAKAKAKAKNLKGAKAKAKADKADKADKAEAKAQAKRKAKGKKVAEGDAEPGEEGCKPKRGRGRRGTPEETKEREAVRATLPSYTHVALDIYWSRSSVGVKMKTGDYKGKQA